MSVHRVSDAEIRKMNLYEKLLVLISMVPEQLLVSSDKGRELLTTAIELAPEEIRAEIRRAHQSMHPDGGKGIFSVRQRAAINGFRSITGGDSND